MAAHGRPELEWEALVEAAIVFLKERARLGRTTSYTELNVTIANRVGVSPFDFSQANERAAMGSLLGSTVDRTYASVGAMLSSLVIYLDANDAGPGFYDLAQNMGLLPPRASAADKELFWVGEVKKSFDRYGGI